MFLFHFASHPFTLYNDYGSALSHPMVIMAPGIARAGTSPARTLYEARSLPYRVRARLVPALVRCGKEISCYLSGSCVDDEYFQRLHKDCEIGDKRARIDILHIELNALLIGDVLATADLPQAGNARSYGEAFLTKLTITR